MFPNTPGATLCKRRFMSLVNYSKGKHCVKAELVLVSPNKKKDARWHRAKISPLVSWGAGEMLSPPFTH